MKKTLLLCILTLCCAPMLTVNAQKQTAKNPKTILEKASAKINGLKSLKANFALHLVSANGKTSQSKSGSFFMKGSKYKITLADQEIICDNKTVWTYVKTINEVQINTYNPAEQTLTPAKLFTDFYDKEYTHTYSGTRTVNGKVCDIIVLTPINNSKQFSKVELAVDKNHTIVGGHVFEKNGNQYRYEINGFTPDANVDDALFTFDTAKYPGVEVIDLR